MPSAGSLLCALAHRGSRMRSKVSKASDSGVGEGRCVSVRTVMSIPVSKRKRRLAAYSLSAVWSGLPKWSCAEGETRIARARSKQEGRDQIRPNDDRADNQRSYGSHRAKPGALRSLKALAFTFHVCSWGDAPTERCSLLCTMGMLAEQAPRWRGASALSFDICYALKFKEGLFSDEMKACVVRLYTTREA